MENDTPTEIKQPASISKFNRLKVYVLGSKKRKIVSLVAVILVIGLGGTTVYFVASGGGKGPLPPRSDPHHAVNMTPVAGNNQTDDNPNHLADCGTTKQLLKNSPVALQDLTTIIPMGNIAPPGHISPTPHMYYNYKNPIVNGQPNPAATNIYAPADITISSIDLFDNASAPKPFNSYHIVFSICKQVSGYFIHVVNLQGKLAGIMSPPWDHTQTSHISGVTDEHVYTKYVNIKLQAGDLIGVGGGGPGMPEGLDFGMSDTRTTVPVEANPARWTNDDHYVCSLDYYPADLSAELYQHIGDYSFQFINPGDPKCGTVYQDVPGTAQGVWFTPDQPKDTPGDPSHEVSLIHSNFNHAQGEFALGNIVNDLGIESDHALLFNPNASGKNVDFNKVTADGKVYCYQIPNASDFSKPDNVILLQLRDANDLRLGSLGTGSCGNGPWQMSAKYIDYVR